MDLAARDRVIAAFRRKVLAKNGITPFPHQADWMLATEGYQLLPSAPRPGDFYCDVLIAESRTPREALVVGRVTIDGPDGPTPCCLVRRAVVQRMGGAAKVCANLAAYKGGKSYFTAAWTAGFAILPNAEVDFIGAEYETSEPEFSYLVEFLCSGKGMGMKAARLDQDKRHGNMQLVLRNGAAFRVRSWTNKESLKGKKRLAYVYTEAYQLPGLEVYTTLAQNLREQKGWAVFATTPDRPWVKIFHDLGHGQTLDWHCVCCVPDYDNPFTFSQKDRSRDDPALGGLMTKERFAIAHDGQLGGFVGKVYDFQRGDERWWFTPENFPMLWKKERPCA